VAGGVAKGHGRGPPRGLRRRRSRGSSGSAGRPSTSTCAPPLS